MKPTVPSDSHYPLQDLASQLERVAQRIREGDCGDVFLAGLVLRANDRDPAVLGFGDADSCRIFETLQLGAQWLLAGLEH